MYRIMKKKNGLKLDTSLPLSCKTWLEKFLFRSDPLNLETVKRKREKLQNIQYLKDKKSF